MGLPTVTPSDDDAADAVPGRGSLLVMGGDQVYPVASEVDYDNRTVGPYLMAYETVGEHEKLPVYAIPGNHDWFDGLDAFLKIFTDGGGVYWRQSKLPSVQSRSYFAIALPHNWWIWAVDTSLSVDGRLDLKQFDYFQDVFKLFGKDDRIILCVAEPSWIKRKNPIDLLQKDSWDNLVAFLEAVTRPKTSDPWKFVRLILSGDKHFYSRHEADRGDAARPTLVTSGGGGAYLSSTLEVADAVPAQHGLHRQQRRRHRGCGVQGHVSNPRAVAESPNVDHQGDPGVLHDPTSELDARRTGRSSCTACSPMPSSPVGFCPGERSKAQARSPRRWKV